MQGWLCSTCHLYLLWSVFFQLNKQLESNSKSLVGVFGVLGYLLKTDNFQTLAFHCCEYGQFILRREHKWMACERYAVLFRWPLVSDKNAWMGIRGLISLLKLELPEVLASKLPLSFLCFVLWQYENWVRWRP